MTEREIVLKTEHLTLNLLREEGNIPILKDINLKIRRGERWGIAGESGAGKSMTMYALTSLLPQKSTDISGRILYREPDGTYTDIQSLPAAERTRYCSDKAALIFQDSMNALNPFERIETQWGETVRLRRPGMSKKERAVHIAERLRRFGIADEQAARRYPHQLSGGMKQRIAIAMALESDASILIADEPTTALDAVNQRKIVDFIRTLCDERNLTLLYISHNLALLDDLCTHAVVLKDGAIIEQGPREQVLHRPAHAYTKKLIEETLRLTE